MQHGSRRNNWLNNHYPFGSIVESRSWKGDYRYGFNGQEGDREVSGSGNSYTAEYWQYDARLGRRWNVDPVYKNSSSNYSVFSNKPTIMVDPLGNSDYYTKRGKYLGSDGTSNTDIMVVTKFSVVVRMYWSNRKVLNQGQYVVANIQPDVKDYFVLPPEKHREEIKNLFDKYDPNENYEIGGRGQAGEDFDGNFHYEHVRAKDGKVAKDGEVAEINLGKNHEDDGHKAGLFIFNREIVYSWHSHTKSKRYYLIGDKKYDAALYDANNNGNMQLGKTEVWIGGAGPSVEDLNNAQKTNSKNNYVLYKDSKNASNGQVHHYDNNRKTHEMSLKFFLETKAKTPESKTNIETE